ncbi:MAG: sigma-54-dependent Fis family transcriptional regulator [Deltaproteobacteria bacterium]|nr:sigma-54-dependent Fis family transcriptional regulator [Deltaproteobacteria bacterium]
MEPHCVLVIDDEQVVCSGCRLALEDKGYRVETTMTGAAGLEAIQEGQYDVVLLDLKLPDMDGMEILREVGRESPGVYVIVMTGYSTVQNAVEAMKTGAFDYLSKPFSDDELLLAVERALEKKRLVEENLSLRRSLIDRYGFHNIVGENPGILRIFEGIQKVAPTDSTVLIYGESGTGKELFARAIHAHSRRAARPFVAMDCSTLAPGILESELFGHVRGAFTGAIEEKAGIFEMARAGTFFLDDVTNLNIEIQGKLLRVLEMQEYKPVGASRFKKADVRIIAATNKDLKGMVAEGRFREDLFYRLNVVPIFLPPLRERKDDIPRLVYYFLRNFCRKTGKHISGFTDDALEMLMNHEWPGNVRELKNVVERLVIMADQGTLDRPYIRDHLLARGSSQSTSIPDTLEELKALKRRILEEEFGRIEKAFLLNALQACDGNITRAAKKVGMLRPNFSALMKKHRISAEDATPPSVQSPSA